MLTPKYQLQRVNHQRCIKVSIDALSFDNETFEDFGFECLKDFGEFKLNGVLIQLKSTVIKELNADEWLLMDFPEKEFHYLNNGWALAIASASAINEIVYRTVKEMKLIGLCKNEPYSP